MKRLFLTFITILTMMTVNMPQVMAGSGGTYYFSFVGAMDTIKLESNENLPSPYVFVEDMLNDNPNFSINSSNSIYMMNLTHEYDEEITSSSPQYMAYLRHYKIEDFKDNSQTMTYTVTQPILKKVGGNIDEIRMESEYIKLYKSGSSISDYTHGIMEDDSDHDYGYAVFFNDTYIDEYLDYFFPQMCNYLDEACNDPAATESMTYTDEEVAEGLPPNNCYTVIRRTHYIDRVSGGNTYRFVAVLNIRLLHHNYAITYTGQMDTINVSEESGLPLPYNSINALVSSNPSLNLDVFMKNKLAVSFVKDELAATSEGKQIYDRTYKIYDKCEPKIFINIDQAICLNGTVDLGSSSYNTQFYHNDDDLTDYNGGYLYNMASIQTYLESYFPAAFSLLEQKCPSGTVNITYTDELIASGDLSERCSSVLKRIHVISKVNKGVTYKYTATVNFTVLHYNESLTVSGSMNEIKQDIEESLPAPYSSVEALMLDNPLVNVQCSNISRLELSFVDELIVNNSDRKEYKRTYTITDKCDANVTAVLVQNIILLDVVVVGTGTSSMTIFHSDDDITDYDGGNMYVESHIYAYLDEKFTEYETKLDEQCAAGASGQTLTYSETKTHDGTPINERCQTVITRTHRIDRVCDDITYRYIATLEITVNHYNQSLTVSGSMNDIEQEAESIDDIPKYATIQELMAANPGLSVSANNINRLNVVFVTDNLSSEDDCSAIYNRTYKIADNCTLGGDPSDDLEEEVIQIVELTKNTLEVSGVLSTFYLECGEDIPTTEHANIDYLISQGLLLGEGVSPSDIEVTFEDVEDEVYPYYFERVFTLTSNQCPDAKATVTQQYEPSDIWCYSAWVDYGASDEYEACDDITELLPTNVEEAKAYIQSFIDEGLYYTEDLNNLIFNYPPFNEYEGALSVYVSHQKRTTGNDECSTTYDISIFFSYQYYECQYTSVFEDAVALKPYEKYTDAEENHPYEELTLPNDTVYGCADLSCLPKPLETIAEFAEKGIDIPQSCENDDLVKYTVTTEKLEGESDDCTAVYERKYEVQDKCSLYKWFDITQKIISYNNLKVSGPLTDYEYNVYDEECNNLESRPTTAHANIDYLLSQGLIIESTGIDLEDITVTYEDTEDETYPFYFEREFTLTYNKCPEKPAKITQQYKPGVIYYFSAWEEGLEGYEYGICKDEIDQHIPQPANAVGYVTDFLESGAFMQEDLDALLFNYEPFSEHEGEVTCAVSENREELKAGCETAVEILISFYYEYYGRIYTTEFIDYVIFHHHNSSDDESQIPTQNFELPDVTVEDCKDNDCLPPHLTTMEEFAEHGITLEQLCSDNGLLRYEVDDSKVNGEEGDCNIKYLRTYNIYCKCTNCLKYVVTQDITVELNLDVYGYLPTLYYTEDMPEAETDVNSLILAGAKVNYGGNMNELELSSSDEEMSIPRRTKRTYIVKASCGDVRDTITQYLVLISSNWNEFEVAEVDNVSDSGNEDGSITLKTPEEDEYEESLDEEGLTLLDVYDFILVDAETNEYQMEIEEDNYMKCDNLPAGDYFIEVYPKGFVREEPIFRYIGKITEMEMGVTAMPWMSFSSFNFYVETFGQHYFYGNDNETGQSNIIYIQNNDDTEWDYYFTVEGGSLISSVWDGGEIFNFYPSIQTNYENNSIIWKPGQTLQLTMNSTFITFHAVNKAGKELTDRRIIYRSKICLSNDPNEIYGPAGYGEEKMIAATDRIDYKILFENDPELATAAAARVKVTCPLHENADPTTIRLGQYGFGDYIFEVPPMSMYYNTRHDLADSLGVWLDVSAGIDVDNNEMYWIFQSIDPETGVAPIDTIGFLPVNDTLTGCGEGFVTFSVMSEDEMATGDTISEQANIIFDDNDNILTNTYTNMFDAVAPTSVTVCDTSGVLYDYSLLFKSVATDDENGSGIRQVDLYVNIDNTQYVLAGSMYPDTIGYADTMALSYRLGEGSLYQFVLQAVDNVGNKEPFSETAQIVFENNNPPLDIYLSNRSFNEDDAIGTLIGEFTTLDDQSSNNFTYSFVDDENYDNHLFTIENNKLKTNNDFRCYGNYVYQILVKSEDVNGGAMNKAFILFANQTMTPPTTLVDHYLCAGDFLEINGEIITEAGYYYDTLQTMFGCDSIVKHIVNHRPDPTIINYNESLCMYEDYSNYGVHLTWDSIQTYLEGWDQLSETTITVKDDTTNVYGCSDTICLNLTIYPATRVSQDVIVCADEMPYFFGDSLFVAAGTKDVVFTSVLTGCDSVVTVNLEVAPSYFDVPVYASICDNEYYMLFDDTIRESGTYYKMGHSVHQCDSSVVLTLEVFPAQYSTDELSLCASDLPYTYGHYTFGEATTSGVYDIVFESINACDSVVSLDLNILQDDEQNNSFYQGWEWFSSYIDDERIDILDLLKDGLANNGLTIKSSTNFINYSGGYWSGNLNSIENEKMYMVETSNNQNTVLSGCVADPTEHPITLSEGWNHIGYISSYTSSVNEAMEGLSVTPSNADIVKSYRDGFAVYFASMNRWIGDLTQMKPGYGYMYFSNSNTDMQLVYPEMNSNGGGAKGQKALEWLPDYYSYPENMTFVGEIVVDDRINESDTLEVGAFCKGERRGTARAIYVKEINAYRLFLTVYGNNGDELSFLLFNHKKNAESALVSNQRMSFSPNENHGSLLSPFQFEFNTLYNTLIEADICIGNVYDENGFVEKETGSYFMTHTDTNGNDSIVKLRLEVKPVYRITEDVIVEQFPYEYDGVWIDEPGVHTFDYTSVHGCDSIMVCSFIPIQETLNLMLTPNPSAKLKRVMALYNFTEEEKAGLVVEVYNGLGVKVQSFEPQRYPIELYEFESAGTYTVRIVTGTGKILSAKLIIM